MYVEINPGIDGIFPYLRYGKRAGITLKRWERDNVTELTDVKPELETILELLYENNCRATNYYHFTFSASEKDRDIMTPELMKKYCDNYFDILMTGYHKVEYMVHVEMHDPYRHVFAPKEKESEEKLICPNYDKMKHAHAVVPAINLKTGTSLPITFTSQKQIRYLAAIQFVLNTKYNLSHPKDQERPIIIKPQKYLDASKRATLEKIALSLQQRLRNVTAKTMLEALEFTDNDVTKQAYEKFYTMLDIPTPDTPKEDLNERLDSPFLIKALLSCINSKKDTLTKEELNKYELKNKAKTLFDYVKSLPNTLPANDTERYFVRKANRFALHDLFDDFPYPKNPLATITEKIKKDFPTHKIDYRFLPALEETICVSQHGKIYGLSCREKAFEEKVFYKTFETNPFSLDIDLAQRLVDEFKKQQVEAVQKRYHYGRTRGIQKLNATISELIASTKPKNAITSINQNFYESLLQNKPYDIPEIVTNKTMMDIEEFAKRFDIDIDIEELKFLHRKERALALVTSPSHAYYFEKNLPKALPFKNYFSIKDNIDYVTNINLPKPIWEKIITSIENVEHSYCREILRKKSIPNQITWLDDNKNKYDSSESLDIER